MAASFGIDYRWPLWDVRLVQQYLSTPSIEKVGPGGLGRYLHRRAVTGVVPQRVAWKPSKDMGDGPLHERTQGEGLIRHLAQARGLEAELHPILAGLIDRATLRAQIVRAAQGQGQGAGQGDAGFAASFGRSVGRLRRLDLWLKGRAT